MEQTLSRWLCVVALLWTPLPASAQAPSAAKKPGESVTLAGVSFKGPVDPGSAPTAVVQFKIDPGYHVQANPASEANFIPAVLKLDPLPGVVWSAPVYPPSKEEKVEGLAKPLKVYEGTFEILVPLKVASDAKLPATLTGVLTYQSCKGAVCFPPKRLKVEIPVAGKKAG